MLESTQVERLRETKSIYCPSPRLQLATYVLALKKVIDVSLGLFVTFR